MNFPRPLLLIVLDGWGYREELQDNAIARANKPVWNHLWSRYPHTLINASANAVGLPKHQMGNSEVGHLNLGAGRIVYQEFSRVATQIESGEFFQNKVLLNTIRPAIKQKKAIHVMGLLSEGGVHSHESHIHGMIEMAAREGAERIYLHAFVDGRDSPPVSARPSLEAVQDLFERLGKGRIASVIGRYYAMDRDNRWARTQAAYELVANGKSEFQARSALEALDAAYERGETDEFVRSTALVDEKGNVVTMDDGDAVVFMNFRSDRARQLTRPFIEPDFREFAVNRRPKLAAFTTLTQYHEDFDCGVAYPAEKLTNTFGEYISNLGLKQLRIAETEKYAHVTFFLNGGVEEPFAGEDRILIPSPHVATYDMQPEMNAPELTNQLVGAIESRKYDVIICNYANPDMVGHTGNFDATVEAIEALDVCLGRVVEATKKVGGELLITADHGNAEMMVNEQTGQAHTAHTTNPVPFIYVGRKAKLAPTGALSDVTPTMLYLMGLEKPKEMGGHSLVTLD